MKPYWPGTAALVLAVACHGRDHVPADASSPDSAVGERDAGDAAILDGGHDAGDARAHDGGDDAADACPPGGCSCMQSVFDCPPSLPYCCCDKFGCGCWAEPDPLLGICPKVPDPGTYVLADCSGYQEGVCTSDDRFCCAASGDIVCADHALEGWHCREPADPETSEDTDCVDDEGRLRGVCTEPLAVCCRDWQGPGPREVCTDHALAGWICQ